MHSRRRQTLVLAVLLRAGAALAVEESVEDQLRRAAGLLADDKPRAALAVFSKLERSHPACLDCLLGVATAQNRLGSFVEAEAAARRALALSSAPPVQIVVWTTIGVSFYNRTPMGASGALLETNMREAEAAFRRAYEVDGGATEAIRWNLASALEWLGQEDAAATLFSDPSLRDVVEPARREEPSSGTGAGGAPIFIAGAVQKPEKISQVPLEYSARARQQEIEGQVVLLTIIDTDGKIATVKVMKGLRGCTMEAIRAVRQWRFRPAMLEGEPVRVYFTVTVNFKLGG